jgi:hypothetical protein
MNWRTITVVNAAIAFVTVSAVIVDLTRSRGGHANAQAESAALRGETAGRSIQNSTPAHIEHIDDLADVRVDNLASVAASELVQLMEGAKPAEIAALARKFNDLPIDAHSLGGLGTFFEAWTQFDPKAALLSAFALNDVTMRKLAARVVVNSASPIAAPDLANYVLMHPDKDLMTECKEEFMDALIGNAWSYLDPEAASQFLDNLPNLHSDLSYTRTKIAYAWGTLDPDAALEWTHKQAGNESVDADSLYREVIKGWCDKNVGAAAAYVEQHLSDSAAALATSAVAIALVERDVESATNWVMRLPSGETRNSAERVIAFRWAEKDPSAAARWASTLSAADQTVIAGRIVDQWMNVNWSEASAWIETLSGDAHDQALNAAVSREAATPQDSLALAVRIGNDELRRETLSSVISQWAAADASSAESWVKSGNLTPEERESLLKTIESYKNASSEGERVIITD